MLAIYDIRQDCCAHCKQEKPGVEAELIDFHVKAEMLEDRQSIEQIRHTETYRIFLCVGCFAKVIAEFGDDALSAASWTLYVQNSLGRPRYTEEQEAAFRAGGLKPLRDSEHHTDAEGVITGRAEGG